MRSLGQFIKISLLVMAFLTAPVTAFAAQVVDINRADAATMIENWKGIGEKKAEAIIKYRNSNGPFSSIDDLSNVKGIGEGTIKTNRKYMSVTKGVSKPTGKKQSSTTKSTTKDTKAKTSSKDKKTSSSDKKATTKKSSSKKSDSQSSTKKKSTDKKSSSKKSTSKSSKKKKCKSGSKDKDCKTKKSKKKNSTT